MLTLKEAAAHLGCGRESVLVLAAQGVLTDRMVHRAGQRKYFRKFDTAEVKRVASVYEPRVRLAAQMARLKAAANGHAGRTGPPLAVPTESPEVVIGTRQATLLRVEAGLARVEAKLDQLLAELTSSDEDHVHE